MKLHSTSIKESCLAEQNITDCQAGQHYVGPKKECRNCPNKPQHKWSNDAATKCEKCNGTNTPCSKGYLVDVRAIINVLLMIFCT